MNILGHDIPDTLVVGAPAALTAVAGWWGSRLRERRQARLDDRTADREDRKESTAGFDALVRAYEREVTRLASVVGKLEEKVDALESDVKQLTDHNIDLERQNMLLRADNERLRTEIGALRGDKVRAGRRINDPLVEPVNELRDGD